VYVSNSENPAAGGGGVGALRFDADGEVVDAYRILDGTLRNCAGGPTPWGTWLSCEEHEGGRVWECDPSGEAPAEVRPALGTWNHEAVAVDPEAKVLYLTEDNPEGRFYRFTPDRWPSLDVGSLEVARVVRDEVDWLSVPDPTASSSPTRTQVAESTAFAGGEGVWFADGVVYFTTKGDDRVWRFDPASSRITVLYEPEGSDPVLDGVDNITVSPGGEVLVCEDHAGEQDLVVVGTQGAAGRLMRLTGQPGSELAGAAFAPAGDRLYVSSQRGGPGGIGITYQITGPFTTAGSSTTNGAGEVPSTTAAGKLGEERAGGRPGEDDGGGIGPLPIAGGVGLALAAAAAGAWRIRSRRDPAAATEPDR
jgi:secreted PhoX family phosphatase